MALNRNQDRNQDRRLIRIKSASAEFQAMCGDFFRKKRLQASKSEVEVADYLKISVELVQSYEAGLTAIPLDRVHSLSAYLDIPQDEIMVLFHKLEEQLRPTPFYEQSILHSEKAGEIIRAARETVSMTSGEVVDQLSTLGYPILEEEFLQVESGNAEPTLELWVRFCQVVSLSIDSPYRYLKWEHLSQIKASIEDKEPPLRAHPKVMKVLEEYQLALEGHLDAMNDFSELQVIRRFQLKPDRS